MTEAEHATAARRAAVHETVSAGRTREGGRR